MFGLNYSLTSRRLDDSVPSYTAIVSVVLMGALFFFVLFLLSKVMTAVYGHYMKKRIIKALLARRDTGDSFRQENGYSWDYVMQFRILDEDEEINYAQRTYNLKRIAQLVAVDWSSGCSTIRCTTPLLLRASPHRLMKEADRINMELEFDEDALGEACRAGRQKFGWGPIETPEDTPYTKIPPFRHVYGPYIMDAEKAGTRRDLVRLYKRWKSVLLAPTGSNINKIGDAHVPGGKGDMEMGNMGPASCARRCRLVSVKARRTHPQAREMMLLPTLVVVVAAAAVIITKSLGRTCRP